MKVILVGNPNTGKTTLFNALTGSNEHVGNFHGVTVEEKAKEYTFDNQKIQLVDLPGLYSLTTLSYEERVAREYFFKEKDAKIISLCDVNNLERNLYLTLNLLEYASDMVVAINNIDNGKNKIDIKKLSQKLGVKVVNINPSKNEGLEDLNREIIECKSGKELPYIKELHLSKIKEIISPYFEKDKLDFYAIKIFERDDGIAEKIPERAYQLIEKILPKNSMEIVAQKRYEFIKNILQKCVISNHKIYGKSKIDKVVFNRFFAFPIFILILATIFYLTFFSVGKFFSSILVNLVDMCIGTPLHNLFTNVFGESVWITSLVDNALVGGVGTIFSFLPQVALLFMFLSLLEDSGYMSRIAFMFEDVFGKIGLSGKSIYTLLMGFGCSSTAILTARNMEDKNAKIKTALLTPYMSCSAKFPIYVVIGGAFFGVNNIFYIVGLYLLGVFISILLSFLFEKTILKSKEQSFILEFPPYRFPKVKRILKILWDNMKLFVIKVGTLLISMNVIVWLLSNFSFKFSFVPTGEGSMLEILGKVICPIFIPLGFGSWGVASSLLAGLIAKEVIVSSIIMFNRAKGFSSEQIAESLRDPNSGVYFANNASVISFLVFSLLYSPCITSIAVLNKEIGRKWTAIGIGIQLVVAYLTALIIYNIFRCIERFGFLPILLSIIVIFMIMLSLILVFTKVKKHKVCATSCEFCKKCSNK